MYLDRLDTKVEWRKAQILRGREYFNTATEVHCGKSNLPKTINQNQSTKQKIKNKTIKLELSDSKAYGFHTSHYVEAHFQV